MLLYRSGVLETGQRSSQSQIRHRHQDARRTGEIGASRAALLKVRPKAPLPKDRQHGLRYAADEGETVGPLRQDDVSANRPQDPGEPVNRLNANGIKVRQRPAHDLWTIDRRYRRAPDFRQSLKHPDKPRPGNHMLVCDPPQFRTPDLQQGKLKIVVWSKAYMPALGRRHVMQSHIKAGNPKPGPRPDDSHNPGQRGERRPPDGLQITRRRVHHGSRLSR